MNIDYMITQGFPTWGAFAYLKGYIQARRYRDAGGLCPLGKFSPSLEKCVGHSSKLLDIV